MMIFKRAANRGGFTLVELLLVIVLIAILMALVTLSGYNMMESTNAQTEARRIIRTVHALRSAWLACYADTQKMIGVPESTWPQATIDRTLSQYSDRNLSEEITRYGKIKVIPPDPSKGSRSIYIGFAPEQPNQGVWSKSSTRQMIKDSLIAQKNDYDLLVDNNPEVNDVYIRIK